MGRTTIKAPKNICIYTDENASTTFDFFNQIDRQSRNRDQTVLVDLSEVESITAAASVLLFATANTAQLWHSNPSQVQFRFPKEKDNPNGYGSIIKTGLARALHSGSEEKLKDLVKSGIFYQSSTDPEQHLLDTVEFLTREGKFEINQFLLLTTGISEAMLNVAHHAYKNPHSRDEILQSKSTFVSRVGQRWWQCAWFDEETSKWVFIICDLGIGIPKSFRGEHYRGDQAAPRDLEIAFTAGMSRFIGMGRGNGSEDMKRLVSTSSNESLLIYSGGAKYYYSTELKEPETEILEHFEGTLVEWTLDAS